MSLLGAIVEAMRPRQFTKNLFVLAALLFADRFLHIADLIRAGLAFLVFCVASSAIYMLNDILDAENDRRHPIKCRRPIASGRLPISVAWTTAFLLCAVAVGAAFVLGGGFSGCVITYLALQALYCVKLKHIVLIDVFTIAAGFVLRTVGGAVAINVPFSHWLILCSLLLALFLGFGKRRQEISVLGTDAGQHRGTLHDYSIPFLDQLILILVTSTLVCYAVYTIQSQTARLHPTLWVTVPVVLFGLFRYLYLVYQKGWGGAPEEAILKDRALQFVLLTWVLVVVFAFRVTSVAHH